MSKIVMTEQSSAPDTPGSGKVAIYVDTDGSLCWRKDDGVIVKIASAGTYTLTIPATGTAALLGTAQTFSAAQTFGAEIKSSSGTPLQLRPGSNATNAVQIQDAGGTAVLTVDTINSLVKINNSNVPVISTALTSWTPAWSFAASGSVTHQSQIGRYIVIGDICHLWGYVRTSAISSPTGNATISLPVTSGNYSGLPFSGTIAAAAAWNTDMPNLRCFVGENSSALNFTKNATSATDSRLAGSDFLDGNAKNELVFYVSYPI